MKQETKLKETEIGEMVLINPKRDLKKKSISKKVSMDKISSFNKKIQGFEVSEYKGGSKFANGDTLLARITPCLENGKTAYVDILDNEEVAFGSTEFIVLSGKKDETINEFVYYLAISPKFRKLAISSMTGTSGRQRVQTDFLKKKVIGIPPLPEQKAIAKILSDLDSKIELLQKQSETLEKLGLNLFREMVSNSENLDDNWQELSLDEIAHYLNGLALQKYPPKGENDLPVIKIRELKQGISNVTDLANSDIPPQYIINDGDILFSWSGSLEVVIWCGGKGALNQHLFKVTSEKYLKWFYYYWTLHHLIKFKGIAAGKATTMGHIKRKHLSEAKVLVPPKQKMEKLNDIFNPIIDKVINVNLEMMSLRKTRDLLLPKLMSGKIRVPVEALR
jgi:type I restriction enzyme, S subunit